MKLKAYKTSITRRALKATLVSDYLDSITLERYRIGLHCSSISNEMYISLFVASHYPIINIDEYFHYIDLMGIDISKLSTERKESFSVLVAILETKYGIEYVDAED